jgi:hypothetical protein
VYRPKYAVDVLAKMESPANSERLVALYVVWSILMLSSLGIMLSPKLPVLSSQAANKVGSIIVRIIQK